MVFQLVMITFVSIYGLYQRNRILRVHPAAFLIAAIAFIVLINDASNVYVEEERRRKRKKALLS